MSDATLVNGSFELDDIVFGTDDSGYPLLPGGFEIGSSDIRTQDSDNPLTNGRSFGTDLRSGVTYTWSMLVHQEFYPDRWQRASSLVSQFESLWKDRDVNTKPGAVDELRIYHGQSAGRIYGRCRNFAADRTQLRKGIATITCDFAARDDLVYDDVLSTITLDLTPELNSGGLITPLVTPLVTSAPSRREGFVDIGGQTKTRPWFEIHGPCSNPSLEMDGQLLWRLNTSLAYDEIAVIDTRPRGGSVTKGVTSIAGRLSASSITLDDLRLSPGTHEFVYQATDETATSTCLVSWRNARHQA